MSRSAASASTPGPEEAEEPKEPEEAGLEADATSEAAGPGEGAPKRRRRRRGGRGRRRKPAGQSGEAPSEEAAEAAEDEAAETGDEPAVEGVATGEEALAGAAKPAARRRRRRSGAKRTTAQKPEGTTAVAKDKEEKAAKREPKRAPKKKEAEPTEEGEEASPTRTARRSRRTTGATSTRLARRTTRRRREPEFQIRRGEDKVMLITERGERDQIAVLEDRQLVEHYITRAGARSMVGNIYLGRVQNVLPGMEAAFVDIGKGRNAVLYAGEVAWDEETEGGGPQRIEQVLKPGQAVLVQVSKDPMGGKGPRLTAQVSLPGRYLVFVPNSNVFGISRRLPDAERRRLRAAVRKVRPERDGVIVRTAAEGASEEDLASDVQRLIAEWGNIEKRSKKAKAPALLYEEPELTVRVVRDAFTAGEFREIVTDSERVFERVTDYLREVAPELVDRIRKHDGKLPLFEEHHVVEQIHKALERKVWLPSGGYIVIERTEAMTVIDVNTGKHVGKTNLEETVVKTNVEAAEETARQLRLRDIGGIIIIDFIDMLLEKNKDLVINTMKEALAQDKTRSQVFDISPLGLLEVTRKRVSAGLLESFSEVCPTCEGRGLLLTHEI